MKKLLLHPRAWFLVAILALPLNAAQASPASRAQRAFVECQARFQKNHEDADAAWQFGLACFDWSDLARDKADRAEIAQQGIAACRQAIARAAKGVGGHYYLALNLGQLASTKKLGALKLVGEMETEFQTAIGLDPLFDYAGPHRSLGLLYAEAPGWPASIGSRNKARLHLRKAVELVPAYPDNSLCLLEALLKWGEGDAVQAQLAATEQTLQKARDKFTGEKWEPSWQDWDRRWTKIKAKAGETSSHLESPSHKK